MVEPAISLYGSAIGAEACTPRPHRGTAILAVVGSDYMGW